MAELTFLSIFFKIVNFIILIFVLSYIFIKYILPSLKNGLSGVLNKINYRRGVVVENNKIIDQLENNFEIYKARIEDISHKLKIWKMFIESQNIKIIEEQQKILKDLQKKREIQSNNLSKYLVDKDIALDLVKNLEVDFTNYITKEDRYNYWLNLSSLMKAELKQ